LNILGSYEEKYIPLRADQLKETDNLTLGLFLLTMDNEVSYYWLPDVIKTRNIMTNKLLTVKYVKAI